MDDRDVHVPGAQSVTDVLSSDVVYRCLRPAILSPWVLGILLAIIAAAMIVFGPSTDSRFIYTDF